MEDSFCLWKLIVLIKIRSLDKLIGVILILFILFSKKHSVSLWKHHDQFVHHLWVHKFILLGLVIEYVQNLTLVVQVFCQVQNSQPGFIQYDLNRLFDFFGFIHWWLKVKNLHTRPFLQTFIQGEEMRELFLAVRVNCCVFDMHVSTEPVRRFCQFHQSFWRRRTKDAAVDFFL